MGSLDNTGSMIVSLPQEICSPLSIIYLFAFKNPSSWDRISLLRQRYMRSRFRVDLAEFMSRGVSYSARLRL